MNMYQIVFKSIEGANGIRDIRISQCYLLSALRHLCENRQLDILEIFTFFTFLNSKVKRV